MKSTEDLIDIYQKRLIEFPHFEHYHINLFYDFNELKNSELIKENYECIQKIHSLKFSDSDNDDEFEKKWAEIKNNFSKLKLNSRKLIEVYQNYLKIIREDIKTLPYK